MSRDGQGRRSGAGVPRPRAAGAALLVSLVAGLVMLVLAAAPALAHSGLVRSDPADGGSVAVGRTQLTLWFDEPIAVAASRFNLITDSGSPVHLDVSTSAEHASAFIELESQPLPRGVVVLHWQTVSAVDGHASTGEVTFGVGRLPPAAAGSDSGSPPPGELILRWLQLSTLMVAVGALVAPHILRRGSIFVPEAASRAVLLGPAAGLAALAATLMAVVLGPESSHFGATLTTTGWGRWWVVHVVALLVATAGLVLRVRRGTVPGTGRVPTALATGGLAIAALSDAAAGHPAELPGTPVLAVTLATVHVLAASVWVGSLVVLAGMLLPTMRRNRILRRPLLVTVWRGFSPIAAGSVAVVTVTGLYLAGQEIPGPGAVTSTWYGLATAGKALALVVVLGVATCTTLVVRPLLADEISSRLPLKLERLDPARFPRLIGTELAVLGVAVVLASVMTTVPAARDQVDAPPATLGSAMADGLFVSYEALPADAGERLLIVRVNAVTRPQPGPVTGVDVLITDARGRSSSITTRRVEPGRYDATVPTPDSASYHVWVAVHRHSAPDAVAGLDWDPEASARVGGRFQVVLTSLAAGIGLSATVLAWVLLRRRRRSLAASRAVPPAGEHVREFVAVGKERGA